MHSGITPRFLLSDGEAGDFCRQATFLRLQAQPAIGPDVSGLRLRKIRKTWMQTERAPVIVCAGVRTDHGGNKMKEYCPVHRRVPVMLLSKHKNNVDYRRGVQRIEDPHTEGT